MQLPRSKQSSGQLILAAHAAHVLVFVAMGNSRPGDPIAFPACIDEIIAVGSTDDNHTKSDFVPAFVPGKRLYAIGEAMEAAWKGSNSEPHATVDRRMGTSYATPVAARIAVMVMDVVWSVRSSHTYECQMLRSKTGMLAVLRGHMI